MKSVRWFLLEEDAEKKDELKRFLIMLYLALPKDISASDKMKSMHH